MSIWSRRSKCFLKCVCCLSRVEKNTSSAKFAADAASHRTAGQKTQTSLQFSKVHLHLVDRHINMSQAMTHLNVHWFFSLSTGLYQTWWPQSRPRFARAPNYATIWGPTATLRPSTQTDVLFCRFLSRGCQNLRINNVTKIRHRSWGSIFKVKLFFPGQSHHRISSFSLHSTCRAAAEKADAIPSQAYLQKQ